MSSQTGDKGTDAFIFHFESTKMQLSKNNIIEEVEVSEPVQKGRLLVSVSDECADEGFVLIAGENCELSANEKSILAMASGYPSWQIDDNDQCSMTVEPILWISKDKMVAEMTFYPAIDHEMRLFQNMLAVLAEEGVNIGVNEQSIEKAILATEEGEKQIVKFVAAEGQPAQHGIDAHIRLKIEIGSIAGEVQKNGSLDFKERRMFVYANEGQLIARVVPATLGTPGKNVLGGTIEPKPGRDVTVRVMEDAIYDEEKGEVIAGKGGVVTVVNDNTFKVSSQQTISGDIDYNTGNIYAKNNVDITGGVKPDFVVAVRGDVRIGEHVQSATVNSQGNLVVKGGVMGENSQLNIRGDVELNFIEKGAVFAGGGITIRKDAYYCNIEAGRDVIVCDSGKIVGGRVVCGGNLRVGGIGSASADPAFIAVGTDATRLNVFEKLHERANEIEEEIEIWVQRHGTKAEKSQKIIGLDQEIAEIRKKLKKFNLISGSPEESLGTDEFSECEADLVVSGEITAGTELRIGNMTMTLKKNLVNQRFRIDNLFKSIVADSL